MSVPRKGSGIRAAVPRTRPVLWAAALATLLAASTASSQARTVRHDDGTVEEILSWGEYTVSFYHYGRAGLAEVVQIRDPQGQVRFEVWDDRVIGPSFFADESAFQAGGGEPAAEETAPPAGEEAWPILRDLNGDGVPELRILGWSGGASCCYTEYLFDRKSTLRNVLVFRGGEYHLYKPDEARRNAGPQAAEADPVQHARGTGTPLLVLTNDLIQHVNGSTHGPSTALVLEWNGSRYVEATGRHREVPRGRSFEYRDALPLGPDGRFEIDDLEVRDLAAGYFANAMLAGEEREARGWLLAHGGEPARRWLASAAPRIKALLDQTPCRFGELQEKRLRSDRMERALGTACSPRRRR